MEYFNYIKVFHILSFVSWMAMLFYLPRLFVYHAENKDNEGFCNVVKIQEQKLFNGIGYLALICTLISGVWLLVLNPSVLQGSGWMHAKITIVTLLVLYHISLFFFMKNLANGTSTKSGRFFRAYNEVPTIALILITIFVIVRPF